MAWWQLILAVTAFAILMLLIYNLLNVFVLSKLKINKWVVLGAAVLVFFLPVFLGVNLQGRFIVPVQSGIFVILFLWFMDLSGFNRNKSNKADKLIIKPKAKPNRVKKGK
jgi:hypothetical protein